MSLPRYPEYKGSGVRWLGEVPSHWELMRLRRCVRLNPSKTEVAAMPRDLEVSFLPMEAVGDDGRLSLEKERPIQEVETGYTYFRDGDVAFAKITPCFENGKGALMAGLSHGVGFGTTELTVARPIPGLMSSAFLHWVFRSPNFRSEGEASMYGAGGQKRVPDDFVRELLWAVPPEPERECIATFLDRETAKIDALIAEQEMLLALLAEKRQATISHAVTRGLNPNAPMKDSGIPWLGEVPAHWHIASLKRLVLPESSISYGIVQPGEPLEEGVPFVQTSNMTNGDFSIELLQKTSLDIAAQYPRSRLNGGEVLLGIRASIGAAHIAPISLKGCNLSRGIARIDLDSKVLNRYLVAYLSASAVDNYWQVSKQGSTFNEVSIETVKELSVPVPPLEEQLEIASFVEASAMEINDLSSEAGRAVELLKERRSTLISAAVTGKVDVRSLKEFQA